VAGAVSNQLQAYHTANAIHMDKPKPERLRHLPDNHPIPTNTRPDPPDRCSVPTLPLHPRPFNLGEVVTTSRHKAPQI